MARMIWIELQKITHSTILKKKLKIFRKKKTAKNVLVAMCPEIIEEQILFPVAMWVFFWEPLLARQ